MDVQYQPAVVVGAGSVASRKVDTLLEYGAKVRVVAPVACEHIEALNAEGLIAWEARPYMEGDLAGARLAICACGVEAVDQAVAREAAACNCPLNVVDVPELCTFIVPAVLQRGPLQIAVSTSGTSPLAARDIKRHLSNEYDEHWGSYLTLMGEVRGLVMARVPEGSDARKPLFELLAKSDLEQRMAHGENPTAEEVYESYVAPALPHHLRVGGGDRA